MVMIWPALKSSSSVKVTTVPGFTTMQRASDHGMPTGFRTVPNVQPSFMEIVGRRLPLPSAARRPVKADGSEADVPMTSLRTISEDIFSIESLISARILA